MEILNFLILPLAFFTLYLVLIKNKYFLRLVDQDYNKPQSFHTNPIPRIGGILIFASLAIYIVIQNNNYFIESYFIWFLLSNFILGLIDDAKIIVNPLKRFILFLLINFFLIFYFELRILNFNNQFLDYLNNYSNFTSFFLVLCCLFFCINGSNLIDGFNGLLTIHIIIILLILFFFGKFTFDHNLQNLINVFLILLLCFLILNFPNAKIFLGDSGSFLLGTITALSIIYISNNNEIVPPHFFAILLYYIFFEIIFSVFRKIFQKKNPFKPDRKHLHMLVFKYIYKKNSNFLFSNYITSILINFTYVITLCPLMFISDNEILCKIYFFILLILYISSYYFLTKINEKRD